MVSEASHGAFFFGRAGEAVSPQLFGTLLQELSGMLEFGVRACEYRHPHESHHMPRLSLLAETPVMASDTATVFEIPSVRFFILRATL